MSALILAPPLSSSVAHVRLDDQEQSEGSVSDASVEDDVRSVVAPPPRVVSAYASERAYVPEPRLLKSELSRPAPSNGSSAPPPAAAVEVTPVRSHSVDKMPAPMPEPIVQPAMVSAPLSYVPAPQYQPLYPPSQQYQPLYAPSQQEYARYEAVDIQYPRVPAYLPPPAYAPPVYQPVAAVSDFKYTPLSSVTPAMPPRAQSVYYPSDLPSDPNHPVFLTPTPPPPRSASVIPGTTLVFSADQRDYGFYQPPVGEPLQLSPADQRLAGFYSLKLPDQRELGFYPKPSPRQQQQQRPVEEEKKKAATTVGESDDNVEVKECNHRGCQRQGGNNGECRRKKRMGALRAAVSKLKGLFSRSPRREKAKEPTEGETTPAK